MQKKLKMCLAATALSPFFQGCTSSNTDSQALIDCVGKINVEVIGYNNPAITAAKSDLHSEPANGVLFPDGQILLDPAVSIFSSDNLFIGVSAQKRALQVASASTKFLQFNGNVVEPQSGCPLDKTINSTTGVISDIEITSNQLYSNEYIAGTSLKSAFSIVPFLEIAGTIDSTIPLQISESELLNLMPINSYLSEQQIAPVAFLLVPNKPPTPQTKFSLFITITMQSGVTSDINTGEIVVLE